MTQFTRYKIRTALVIIAASGALYQFTIKHESVGPVADTRTGLIASAEMRKKFMDFVSAVDQLHTKAYRDQGGVWTICYGTTVYPDGRRVAAEDSATKPECMEWLGRHFETRVFPELSRCINPDLDLTLGEAIAYASFTYNTGKYCGTGLARAVNAGDCEAVAREMLRWHYVGKKPSPGLILRRKAEIALLRCRAKS
ncbi:MAG: hypothetical protein LBI68_11035 [Azoarcus sp.]|jgi:lysozyme|nr:hypothetical protein [Azoarcus sp.]